MARSDLEALLNVLIPMADKMLDRADAGSHHGLLLFRSAVFEVPGPPKTELIAGPRH